MLKRRLLSMGCAAVILISFSACTKKLTIEKIETDPVSERIAEASVAAASSLKVLARVNNAKSYRSLSGKQISQDIWQNRNVPFNLSKKVDVDKWSGPAESILRNFSETSGYRFRVSGYAPVPELLVHISGKDRMVIDYIYDIGYQMGDRGDVVIYPPKNGVGGIIDLKYLHELNN